VLASDDALRVIAGLVATGCGLIAAGAVASWRRSWQRGRRRRNAWGRLAWALLWVAIAGIVVAFILSEVVVVLPAALGSLLLGSALLPEPSEQPAPPRFVEGWTPLEAAGGRLAVHRMQLAVPESWSAFRVPDTEDYADVLALLPNRRRLDLPIPILAVGRLIDEATDLPSSESLVEQFRKLGHDTPIEITSATGRTAYVAGETATVLDVEAWLLDAAIPVPRLLVSMGKAVAVFAPLLPASTSSIAPGNGGRSSGSDGRSMPHS
jgi:hypothetical protein